MKNSSQNSPRRLGKEARRHTARQQQLEIVKAHELFFEDQEPKMGKTVFAQK
jgi:hypothetical protein